MNACIVGRLTIDAVVGDRRENGPQWRQRIAAAVSQHGQLKAIADAAGMTSPQLQKIANGTNQNPRVQTLARIAEALGITFEELMVTGPDEDAGHADDRSQGSAVLERELRRLRALDDEAPADDTWRGDILKAIAALTRALRRPDESHRAAASDRPVTHARRGADSGR